MLKLGNVYRGVKKHAGKIAVGAVLIGAGVGIRSCAKGMGEVVYRGEIDGKQVVYEEGKFDFLERKNTMSVVEGDRKYDLIDIVGETNIDWKNDVKPNFEKDELEDIIKNEGREKFSYWNWGGRVSGWDPTTIDERRIKKIFEEGNEIYNDLRIKIREKLRADYEAQPSPFDSCDDANSLN